MTFRSFKNRECVVEIYDDNWSGGVTALIPAATPITIDEDDDEDLLNVIRAKTGYISVIEENYGDLADLYPTTNKSHYVRVVYGGSQVFIGYMQPQAFDQPVSPGPTELSFPIMSGLAMLDDFRFNAINPPTHVTLGELLYEAIQEMELPYSRVIFPRLDNSSYCLLSKQINSLVVSPFNSDYSPVAGVDTDLFSPLTYRELLEGICNAFGLILYDEGNDLIFRRVDHGGTYVVVSVIYLPNIGYNWDEISSVHGDTALPLSSYFDWCDDEGNISLARPYQRIVREQDGNYTENVEFDFKRLKNAGIDNRYPQCLFLRSYTPELTGYYLNDGNYLDQNGYIADYGVNALIYAYMKPNGELDSRDEMFCVNVNPSWSLNNTLFTVMLAERPTGNEFYVNFTQRWGDRLWELTDEGEDAHYTLGVQIRVNGQYFHGSSWSSSPLADPGFTSQSIHVVNAPRGPVEIIFQLATAPSSPKRLVAISDVKMSEVADAWSDYTVDKNKEYNIDNNNGDGDGTTNVSNLLSVENVNDNFMYPQTTGYPSYAYLMESQKRLQGRFKIKSTPSYQLLTLFYDSQNVKWRIIARSYNYRDDEVTLTLHHSSEFE